MTELVYYYSFLHPDQYMNNHRDKTISHLAPDLFMAMATIGLMSFIIEQVLPGAVGRVTSINLIWLLVVVSAIPLFFISNESSAKNSPSVFIYILILGLAVFFISPVGLLGRIILAVVVSIIGLSLLWGKQKNA